MTKITSESRNTIAWQKVMKGILFLCLITYLYYIVINKGSYTSYLNTLDLLFNEYRLWLTIPVCLFLVNWSVEALKWQYLIQKVEAVTFRQAFKGVLTGVAFGVITPMAIGDYIGRILQLDTIERLKTVGAVFVSRIAQFYVTLVWGSFSLLIFYSDKDYTNQWWLTFLWWVVPALNIAFWMILLFYKQIMQFVAKQVWLGRIYEWFEIISTYSIQELLFVICLSFFRYFIFTIQFLLILYWLGVSKDISLLLIGVNFVFLVKSIVPSLFDLGVRESAAVYFFSLYGCPTDLILFSSLSLWVINILIPAFIGLFFIFRIRIFTK